MGNKLSDIFTDKVLERGERIELLVDKTEDLHQNAIRFKKSGTALKRAMWFKNVKLMAAIAGIILVSIFWLVVVWQTRKNNSSGVHTFLNKNLSQIILGKFRVLCRCRCDCRFEFDKKKVIIFIIVLASCGGFTFSKCRSSSSDSNNAPASSAASLGLAISVIALGLLAAI
jgi:4-amino-4-deoxy-L-arabinose transferase-like glycosyltransferase